MTEKIGTLSDRIANRLVRHLPRRTLTIRPETPIVSFTFDDAPVSAGQRGADIIEAVGGRATYYVAGGLAGSVSDGHLILEPDGYADLAARGHELGAHTFAHRKLAFYSRAGLISDFERNDAWLRDCDGRRTPRNFAVPFIMASPLTQPLIRKYFLTSRGGQPGINRDIVDPHYLYSVELGGETDPDALKALCDALARDPGWLIFFAHDISNSGSRYSYAPDALAELARSVAAQGFRIASIDGAIDLLGAREQLTAAVAAA